MRNGSPGRSEVQSLAPAPESHGRRVRGRGAADQRARGAAEEAENPSELRGRGWSDRPERARQLLKQTYAELVVPPAPARGGTWPHKDCAVAHSTSSRHPN